MHSHLLPGIDDGSPDLETSIELIRRMMKLGFKKFVTTPHIMWEMYKNTPEIVNKKLDLLRAALKKESIDVEINAAAEYFLDEHVEKLLSTKQKLLTVADNMVLVEFSLANQPFNVKEILFEMTMQGYQPIIAHPERYIYFEQAKDFYDELKDSGYYFQLNINSLSAIGFIDGKNNQSSLLVVAYQLTLNKKTANDPVHDYSLFLPAYNLFDSFASHCTK